MNLVFVYDRTDSYKFLFVLKLFERVLRINHRKNINKKNIETLIVSKT